MVSIHRCDSNHQDFRQLVQSLDQDLNERNGETQSNYDQYNVIQSIDTVVVAYVDHAPAGCGCFKQYDPETVEIKRMFVKPEYRGLGISKQIVAELENWALELGYTRAVLETGVNQSEAIGLYTRIGYSRIDNYGQYAEMPGSVCFGKKL